MSAHNFKTITIDSDVTVRESTASGAITPGQLVEQNALTTYRRHATQDGVGATTFAVEDDLQGKEISEDYSSGSKVFFKNFRRGDKAFAFLADGENASVNSFLSSHGDGNLEVEVSPVGKAIIARALEALNLTDSEVTPSRILVEIM